MRFVISLLSLTFVIFAQDCADLCPLPNVSVAALAPCINVGDIGGCCTYGRILAEDPCVRVWLLSPELEPYRDIIRNLKDECDVRAWATCNDTVTDACSQCNDTSALSMYDEDNNSSQPSMMAGQSSGSETCGEGEEYTSCQSSSCFEDKCIDGQVQKSGPICTTDCRQGCKCKDGWARNETGSCVSQEWCVGNAEENNNSDTNHTSCATNEQYEDCGSSSCWEPHCQNGKVVTPGPMCTMDCRQGCKCDDGYARDRTLNTCISVQKCTASAPRGKKGPAKGKKGKIVAARGKNGKVR